MREAMALVSFFLEPIYRNHFGREHPANLPRVLVEKSFTPGALKFGGQTIGTMSPMVHAAEALKAGYSYLSVGREAEAACATALGVLLRRCLTTETAGRLQMHDIEYLALLEASLDDDRQWGEAVRGLPKTARSS